MTQKQTPINNTIISGDRGSEPPKCVKIVVMCAILLGIFFFLLSLGSCNSSRRYRAEQAHLVAQDSAAQTQDNTASKSDSTSLQENTEVTTKYYDSSLQAALELAFDNQTDYANQSGAYEKLTPIVVTKLGDTGYSIDPGGRNLKTANLKYNRQNKKSDSTAKKNTSNVAVAKTDTTSKAANIVVKKKEEARAVVVQKKTWRPSPWMIGGVVLLIVLAAGVYYFRKPLGLVRKVVEEKMEKPAPVGLRKFWGK